MPCAKWNLPPRAEVFVEVPDVRWKDVGGLSDIKQRLVEAVSGRSSTLISS